MIWSRLVISYYFLKRLGIIAGLKRIWWGAKQSVIVWWKWPVGRLSLLRNSSCYRCDMYDGKFGTCGEVGQVYRDASGQTQPVGCWCQIHVANRNPEKSCWLREQGYDDKGWPDELMPK